MFQSVAHTSILFWPQCSCLEKCLKTKRTENFEKGERNDEKLQEGTAIQEREY